VRQGQREGVFDASIDPRDAGKMFAGLLQGATLTRRLETHEEPLHIEGARMLAIWMKGILSAGVPVPAKTRPVERAADSRGLIA
jgi:hypothetical protein